MSERVAVTSPLVAAFARHAAAVDTEVRELHGVAELHSALAELTGTSGGAPLRVAGTSAASVLGFPAARGLDDVLQTDLTVAVAAAGVAETGSLAITPTSRTERLAHVLPPTQVVVLPVDSLVETLAEAMELAAQWTTAGQPYVSFITGPSRTADIERVLTVGAHGPRRLVVLVVHGWNPAVTDA